LPTPASGEPIPRRNSEIAYSAARLDARNQLAHAIARTAAGDAVGFREVYHLTYTKLLSACLLICGERQAAEDTLHEVYLSVWNKAGSYDPTRGSPMNWLMTIARSRSLDWLRYRKTRTYVSIDDAPPVVDISPTADEVMIAAIDAEQLHRCLHGLDDRYRAAITSAFFEDMTHSEIAARYAVPLGTIKGWIRRGMATVRAKMELENRSTLSQR